LKAGKEILAPVPVLLSSVLAAGIVDRAEKLLPSLIKILFVSVWLSIFENIYGTGNYTAHTTGTDTEPTALVSCTYIII
jgi:hypothetical protein